MCLHNVNNYQDVHHLNKNIIMPMQQICCSFLLLLSLFEGNINRLKALLGLKVKLFLLKSEAKSPFTFSYKGHPREVIWPWTGDLAGKIWAREHCHDACGANLFPLHQSL